MGEMGVKAQVWGWGSLPGRAVGAKFSLWRCVWEGRCGGHRVGYF